MNEREFAEYVNRVTSLARTYANHQSLRERVCFELTQFFSESVSEVEELREENANHRKKHDLHRAEVAGLHHVVDRQAEDIRRLDRDNKILRHALRTECEQRNSYAYSDMRLRHAIEAMRTAGGSEEFQIAFDRAKELASAL